MYETHYGLNAAPFRLSPDPQFFFPSGIHKKALAYLQYGLSQGEGFVVVAGEAGTGKSMLAQTLISQLDTRRLVIGQLVTTQLDASDLLRMVAAAFKLPSEGAAKATLLNDIGAFLAARAHEGRRVLLVVDEAQNLPAFTLEELRMLSNFQARNKSLLQTFLLGQERFLEILRAPGMEQFCQRVTATCRLKPLSEPETLEYIDFRLRCVGWTGEPLFTELACRMVHRATGGLPRKINMVCDRTLLSGSLEGHRHITRDVVQAALDELQEEMFPINGNLDFSDVPPEPEPPAPEPPPDEPDPGPDGGNGGGAPPPPNAPGPGENPSTEAAEPAAEPQVPPTGTARAAAPPAPITDTADAPPPVAAPAPKARSESRVASVGTPRTAPRPPPAAAAGGEPTPAAAPSHLPAQLDPTARTRAAPPPPAHRQSQWRTSSGVAPLRVTRPRTGAAAAANASAEPAPRPPALPLERDEIEAHRLRARPEPAPGSTASAGSTRRGRRVAALALTVALLGTAVVAAHQYVLHARPGPAPGPEAVPAAADRSPTRQPQPIDRGTATDHRGTRHPVRKTRHPARSRAVDGALLAARVERPSPVAPTHRQRHRA